MASSLSAAAADADGWLLLMNNEFLSLANYYSITI
jgi:hypothetical protein